MSDPGKAVFLSYASQDAEAARRLCDALRASGVEVWFDRSELVGGDQWDAKIRKQISECALFVPVISANTQARLEGYFRIEWKLAARRTHAMAAAKAFLFPVVIDATRDAEAHVPDEFREVQWTKALGGEVPAAFGARVKRLLSGGPQDGSQRTEVRTENREPGVAVSKRLRWLAPVIAGVVVALLALLIPRLGEKGASPTVPAKAIEKATAATLTPAQQLVAKARTILDQGDELNRETYALAEELLLKAEALDVTEASAWTLHASVSASRIGFGLDRSAARREALHTQTGRAIQLAPGSLDAQLAECEAFSVFEQDVPGVIARLQALAASYPNDWRVPDQLSRCYGVVGKLDEAVVASGRALQLSPDNPRLKSNRINSLVFSGLWAEAETSIVTMLQGRTGARLLAHHVYLKLMWDGDLAGAAAAVRSWPAWFLLEDRGVGHAALVALWNRDPGSALAVVQKFPRDYIRDFLFTGPSAVLSAWANEQAGNVESAHADWRIVQQVAERELRVAPDDPYSLHWKAWALARLGDTPAAANILQQLLEKNISFSAMGQVVGRLGGLALTVGRTDLALAQIAQNPPRTRAITKTDLRLNPLFDSLRDDLRFQAVIDAALGPAEKKEAVVVSAAPDAKSVAVLAFANLSDEKANEYFSDGISEELLNVLAKVPGLKVTARTSSFHFKGKDTPIPEIARQLGVAYVVEGSVRKSGDKVRITAQLIKAADGFHVWSDTFTRELKDVFAVQDEIAGLIAKELKLTLAAGSRGGRAVDPDAMELYLRGRQAWALRTPASLREAERLMEQAIALQPDFARAHVGLADVWLMMAESGAGKLLEFRNRRSPEWDRIVNRLAEAARLDPDSAEYHTAQGNLANMRWKFPEVEGHFRRAWELNPNYATALQWYARFLTQQGRMDEALQRIDAAMLADPFAPRIVSNAAMIYVMAGRPKRGLELAERALVLQPGSEQARIWKFEALLALGRGEDVAAAVRAERATATPSWSRVLVSYLALAGCGEEAKREYQPLDKTASFYAAVREHLIFGRTKEAVALLEADGANYAACEWMSYLALFDPIRSEPRFIAMLTQLGLDEAHARAQAWRAANPPEKPEATK